MDKIFLYIPTLEYFLTKKISVSNTNTEYITGSLNSMPVYCSSSEIDITWESICFIADVNKIWTHGAFFSSSKSDNFINDVKLNGTSLTKTNNSVNIELTGLPAVTAADNGKILMVVDGQWALVSPSTLYSGNALPNNVYGKNGDIYVQTDEEEEPQEP